MGHQYRAWSVVARCRDEVSGPSSFNEAKANALAGEGLLRRLLHRESNRPPQRTAGSPARPRRGGGVMAHRNLFASKNLDVPETSHDPVTQAAKGSAGDLTPEPLLSVVCPDTATGTRAATPLPSSWQQAPLLRPSDQPHRGSQSCENNRPSLGCPRDDPLVRHCRVRRSRWQALRQSP